ncbi:hypothetical protein MNBD_GAMMA11-2805 [hydrothermal vent metagenome]|uniref:DUF7939 domain-containing protein n=1 Tax=hydrothermal vent metagenome TaxID=652676 RepID=A0A3B0WXZ6_9ZZZZ
MKTNNTLIYIFSLLVYLLISTANAADIRVIVDRSQVQLNETFSMKFESTENVDGEPDFSPLERDFKIISKSTSSNMSITNGQYKKTSRWNLSLMPMQVGTITIPPISFGSDQSRKLQITITPVKKSTGRKGQAFISELEISTSTAYVQSQIIVTQRMLSARNINGYEFSPLDISGVDVVTESLGDVKQYQTTIDNTPYLVLEKIHAIYPQAHGELLIKPSLASARVAINNRSSYDPFRSNTKTVRRSSDKKKIHVKNMPRSFKGRHWLPAREIQLVEEFPENETFKAGEPITRTISLLADGQSASQLPEIVMDEIKGLKQYPDKPLLNNNKREDGITGVQQIKFALIPAHEGKYTLPAITIPWWNTQTDKMEIAKIAARTFTVKATAVSASSTITPRPTLALATSPESNTHSTTTSPPSPSTTAHADNNPLWKIIALLLACGWGVTLIVLWKSRHNNKPVDSVEPATTHSLKQAYRQLRSCCEKKNAQACKNALLVWASALFADQSIHSLGQLSRHVNAPLARKISDLNAHLYKQSTADWTCEGLADLCMKFEKSIIQDNRHKKNHPQLETLYR